MLLPLQADAIWLCWSGRLEQCAVWKLYSLSISNDNIAMSCNARVGGTSNRPTRCTWF